MSRTYITLSGETIGALPAAKALGAADVRPTDAFLVSQPALSGADPYR